ncbi:MAG: class II fructose-bisphosphate aldolase [Kiritimatiellia bacterium]|jgi:fructose-bisphosphate aldolase class II|nr:class II fructose-bisphosphate aldolase [Kiritimatiellia bacterium]
MKSLSTVKNLLNDARTNHYAVPGFECLSDMYVRPILDVAEQQRSPVILLLLGCDVEGRAMHYLAGLIHSVAPHYDIPIAMQLDHATDIDVIKRCIDHGFTSVMFDGTALPYEKNVEVSARVVELAKPHGVSVEAELGCVAGKEIDGADIGETVLTRPEDVVEFVEATGVDALAVSIGTAHGIYASKPDLDIETLKAIDAVSQVPLVLHGGSDTPADQVQEAVRNGITKFNVYTDTRLAINSAIPETLKITEKRPDELSNIVFQPIHDSISKNVRSKIAMALSSGRV